MIAIEEGVSLMAREALFDTRKRPSPIEKGVSFILLKASPSPSKGGGVLLSKLFFDLKCKVHNSKMRLLLLLKNINKFFAGAFFNTECTNGTEPERYTEFLKEHGNTQKLTPIFIQLKASPSPSTASPPSPLRMERGVNTISRM